MTEKKRTGSLNPLYLQVQFILGNPTQRKLGSVRPTAPHLGHQPCRPSHGEKEGVSPLTSKWDIPPVETPNARRTYQFADSETVRADADANRANGEANRAEAAERHLERVEIIAPLLSRTLPPPLPPARALSSRRLRTLSCSTAAARSRWH